MNQSIRIAEADPDSPEVVNVLHEVFSLVLSKVKKNWATTNKGPRKAWIAWLGDEVAGSAIVRWKKGTSPHLWMMAVRETFRGKGAGNELMAAIEKQTRKENLPSISVRTSRRWTTMHKILRSRGWFFEKSAKSDWDDGLEEQWSLPLLRNPMRVLVVGANPAGRGGEWIQALIRHPALFQIDGVCDVIPENRKHWKNKGFPSFQDLATAVKTCRQARGAILALPHQNYQENRDICLQHNLAMLHEKPLACNLLELQELAKKASEAPFHLVVGVQRRTHPAYVVLREKLIEDTPKVLCIDISLGLKGHGVSWRTERKSAGGGALLDLGFHAIDLAHFLLGSTLETVSCNLWVVDPENGKEMPAIGNELESGATLTGRCGSAWVRICVNRFGVKGEKVFARGASTWEADRGMVSQDGSTVFSCESDWSLSMDGCLARFVRMSMGDPEPLDLWDHFSALRVIEHSRVLAGLAGFHTVESFK